MNQEIKDRIEQIRQEIIPAGYKQYRNDIFPSDWEVKQLKDIAPLQRGFDLPASKVNIGDTPVCYSNGISRYHNEYKVEGPGVVTGRSGTIGNVFYITDNFWPHNTTLWVTDFKRNVEKFVYYLYKYIKLERFHAGTGVPTLNRNDVHMHKIPIPNKVDEQQKIADILSTWDRAIELKESLVQEKEEHKKGLMNELLSPKSNWEIKDLGKLVDRTKGKAVQVVDDGKYPVLGIQFLNGEVEPSYTNDSSVLANQSDILLLWDGANAGNIYTGFEGAVGSTFMRLRPKGVNSFFIREYMRKDKPYIKSIREGSGIPHIPRDFLSYYKVHLPSIEEQHRIAKILSTADQEIDLLKQEVEQLKEQKKGLMQLLLTGIVRVKEAVTSG